jgi:Dyp-type peroxidase family
MDMSYFVIQTKQAHQKLELYSSIWCWEVYCFPNTLHTIQGRYLMAEGPFPNFPFPKPPIPHLPSTDLPLRNGQDSVEIQGDILAGFNKDYRTYLFLQFPDTVRARAWLGALAPLIAPTIVVAAFNERFSAAHQAQGGADPPNLKATWVNVSFTYAGLALLFEDQTKLPGVTDYRAFVEGPVGPLNPTPERPRTAKADQLLDIGTLSGPEHWVIGGIDKDTKQDKQKIHALLNIQSDTPDDLLIEVGRMRALAAFHGLVSVFEQSGATLPGDAAGHEHFGFKDGISQPGVLGFHPAGPPNPDDPTDRFGEVDGKPGTTIIASGEFILGHPIESPGQPLPPDGRAEPEILADNLAWMRNGSFQVFRRLAQDVPSFWGQITANIHTLPAGDPLNEELLGAKLVGRWRSGTPLDLAPDRDNPFLGSKQENNFHFYQRDAEGNVVPNPASHIDNDGLQCPRFAHIRKVYPRANNFAKNRSRRIIRRGVPFGLPFQPTAGAGHGADAERGLLFVAYMRSLADQFEFLQRRWVNNEKFPLSDSGPDPIIGTARPDDTPVSVPVPSAEDNQLATNTLKRGKPGAVQETPLHFERWVHTTGAVYTFVPSIPTLVQLALGLL